MKRVISVGLKYRGFRSSRRCCRLREGRGSDGGDGWTRQWRRSWPEYGVGSAGLAAEPNSPGAGPHQGAGDRLPSVAGEAVHGRWGRRRYGYQRSPGRRHRRTPGHPDLGCLVRVTRLDPQRRRAQSRGHRFLEERPGRILPLLESFPQQFPLRWSFN